MAEGPDTPPPPLAWPWAPLFPPWPRGVALWLAERSSGVRPTVPRPSQPATSAVLWPRCGIDRRPAWGGTSCAIGARFAASSGEEFVDRLDQPRNVDLHGIPEDAMVDNIVSVDEVISCARDLLPRNIFATLLELGRKPSYPLAHNFNAAFGAAVACQSARRESSVWAAHNAEAFAAASRICARVIRGSRRLIDPRKSSRLRGARPARDADRVASRNRLSGRGCPPIRRHTRRSEIRCLALPPA